MAERPHLAAAFFCEKVLQEKDNVLSAIRVVDTLYVSMPKDVLPPDVKPSIQTTLLLSFKKAPGNQAEKHKARLRIHTPSGEMPPAPPIEFYFQEGEVAGANLILNVGLPAHEFGTFRVEVFVDDVLMTVVPFRLLERTESQSPAIH